MIFTRENRLSIVGENWLVVVMWELDGNCQVKVGWELSDENCQVRIGWKLSGENWMRIVRWEIDENCQVRIVWWELDENCRGISEKFIYYCMRIVDENCKSFLLGLQKCKICIKSYCYISKKCWYQTSIRVNLKKKYEMDLMSIVEDTERTRFCPQMDRRTRWYQYTPLSTSLKRGYNDPKLPL